MAIERPDEMAHVAAGVLAVGLLIYLALTLGFVCGICLLGVHALLVVAAVLLAMSALAMRTVSAGLRLTGAAVLAASVVGPWLLYLNGVFDHVGGLTVPTGMTIGATIALLDRMLPPPRVAMIAGGALGLIGLLLVANDMRIGFRLHQASLLVMGVLLLIVRGPRSGRHRGADAQRAR